MSERGHVVVVLPGRAYGPELPVLRLPALVLAHAGAEVRVVTYPPVPEPGDADGWARFDEQVAAAVAAAVAGAARVTLVGKSLGTRAMALLPEGAAGPVDAAVWLTPVLGLPGVAAGAVAQGWPSLFVYGTADPMHDTAAQAEVTAALRASECAIEGADHSLEVRGDAVASARALVTLTEAVAGFVGHESPPAR